MSLFLFGTVLSLANTPVSVVSDAWNHCTFAQTDFCDGYMLATFDRMSIDNEICPNGRMTVQSARALLRDYLTRHPNARSYSFPQAISYAFREAFPCSAAER